jgi:hypothetical protein
MLRHPFFTQFFPNPESCLKRPDNTQYKVFIVSKDNPLTWNPVFTGDNYGLRLKPYLNLGGYKTQSLNQYNYNNLLQRYDNLKKEYNQIKTNYSSHNLDNLKRELKEKEERINQIMGRNADPRIKINNGYKNNYNNNVWIVTYNDLKKENYNLKNQLNHYQTYFNNQNGQYFLDNALNNIRNSITQNNKVEFSNALTQLRTNLDNVTQNNYNTIIMMKNQEIAKLKEYERIRAEREKQQLSALINKYDKTLTLGEKENQKLKMRLKELQGYFA